MIKLEKQGIAETIKMLANVVDKNHALPILRCLLIEYSPESISITASDTETTLRATVDGDCSDTGQCTVPAHKLAAIVAAAPDGGIKIKPGIDKTVVSAGRSRFTLSSLDPDNYPIKDDARENAITIAMSGEALATLLRRVHSAAAKNDVRYYLNGVLIEIDGNTLRAVATDGHRLHLAETSIDAQASEHQIIVPIHAIGTLQKLAASDTVSMSIADSRLTIKSGAIEMQTTLIDGRFPPYRKVIPNGDAASITIDSAPFLAAVNRCAILSNENFKGLRLTIKKGSIDLTAANEDREQSAESIDVDYSGDAISFGINALYLTAAIVAIGGDQVTLNVISSDATITIYPVDENNRLAVLMPMRL
jgi:DNA polymerase-3 subunit beta